MGIFSKKIKEKTVRVGSFYVAISMKMARIKDIHGVWKLEFRSETNGYILILNMLDNNMMEELERLALVLFSACNMAVSDMDFLKKLTELEVNVKVPERTATNEDDEEALRETEAIYEQTEESVEKHIKAQKENEK